MKSLVSFLLVAGPAAALTLPTLPPPCPLETVSVCQTPGYFQTACGEKSLNSNATNPNWVCRTAAHNAAVQAAQAGGAVQRTVLVPETLQSGAAAAPLATTPGATQAVWAEPYAASNNTSTGGSSFGAALAAATPAQQAVWATPQTLPAGTVLAASDPWPDTDIATCTEYAYEKYFDFSRLEAAGVATAHEPRAVVQRLLTGVSGWGANGTTTRCTSGACTTRAGWTGATDVGLRPVGGVFRQRSGAALPAVPMGGCRYKTAFHEPGGALGATGSSCHYTENWTFHEQANAALQSVPTETLEYLQDVQRRYRNALARRRQLTSGLSDAQSLQCVGKPPIGACQPKPAPLELIAAVDAELTQLASIGQAHGCFGTGYTACDWAPSLLVDRVYKHFRSAREADYQRCTTRIGTRLTTLGSTFPAGHANTTKRYSKTPTVLESWFTDWAAYVAAALSNVPFDATTNKHLMAQTVGGLPQNQHSALFDLNVSKSFTWGIFRRPGTSNVCNLEGRAEARLAVDATAFGQNVQVFDGHFELDRTHTRIGARLFGQVLVPEQDNPTFQQSWVIVDDTWNRADRVTVAEVPVFTVGLVALEVGGGFAYDVGVDADVRAELTASSAGACNTNAKARAYGYVTPYAWVEGFAQVAVSVLVVEAGIKGVLRVVDAKLPFTFDLSVDTTLTAVYLKAAASLDAQLRLFSGALKAFLCIDLLFWEDCAEETLVSWPGLREDARLLNVNMTLPVPAASVFDAITN